MSKDLDKEARELLYNLDKQGWIIENGKKHRKCHHPKGGFVVMSYSAKNPITFKKSLRNIEELKEKHEKELYDEQLERNWRRALRRK